MSEPEAGPHAINVDSSLSFEHHESNEDIHNHQVLFKIENERTLRHNKSDPFCLLQHFLQIVLLKWSRSVDVSRLFLL